MNRKAGNKKNCHKITEFPLCAFAPLRLCVLTSFAFLFFFTSAKGQRQDISLNNHWLTSLNNTNQWKQVNVPHNWDDYYGYRRLQHGNLHGNALYKKTFTVNPISKDRSVFLFFEGVGSYATVYVNNKLVGYHAGGRTTFTLDITNAINKNGIQNNVLVKVTHPANIKDLPWVCGACSDERGFSEGSQPMGIFRPVHLIITSKIRIEPFGIHAWAGIQNDKTALSINTTIKNYSAQNKNIAIFHQLIDAEGKRVASISTQHLLMANDSITILQNNISVEKPKLWSVENPYCYKIISCIIENNTIIDQTETSFGFRTINWKNPTHQFLLNGKPLFINGIAEYEHLFGQSHAFSNAQIEARIKWIQAAGFNAFRDGHQPHNLLYGKLCDQKGILWWTQFSAHVWYDTKEFRDNFKQLLKEWVIERRNDPAVILWGLQNESKLPKDFAEECTALIRSLDPATSAQRLITTCNGGEGTDWDVPQNWTGTYGGNPAAYALDLKKQILVGEYGAWRTIDLHTEGAFEQNGIFSEDRMVQLMEQKIRLAQSVKDSIAGHFFWLLTSHDNPGRVQGGEGLRELDRIGPVNYKGLLTPWEEPADAFYMYRANYTSGSKQPMVYIVSHTWPNRWMKAGIKDSINVYSNCDEVELFNDIGNISLGKQKRNGIGTHFQWNKVEINFNVLYAVGYVNGKVVAKDTMVFQHLPQSPNFNTLYSNTKSITTPQSGYNYLYRINCGGPQYTDENGNSWQADKAFPNIQPPTSPSDQVIRAGNLQHPASSSWTNNFPGMPAFFASQRRTFAPIKNTKDWKLFQSFRYGKDKLKFTFPLPDGEYMVELYFIEPWLGIGGGMNAKGMRLFDVAINNKTVLYDLDIWSEAGTNSALKKTIRAKISGGQLVISFPESKVGEAIISAIAIATLNTKIATVLPANSFSNLSCPNCKQQSWLDIGDKVFSDTSIQFNSLPSNLFGADWFQFQKASGGNQISLALNENANLFIAIPQRNLIPFILKEYEDTKTEIITDEGGGLQYAVFRKRFSAGSTISLTLDKNFLLMLLPISNLQPAYDLKPITAYRADITVVSNGINKEQFAGRECAVLKTNSKVTIDFPVQTGVADIYSLTVKYFSGNEKAVKGKLQLIGAGNSMIPDQDISFTFTRDGKWNQFTTNTGTMINAGNYTLRLILENAKNLAISGIEIQ
jgi:hypothetical protein